MNIRINANEQQHHGVVFHQIKHFRVIGVKSQYFLRALLSTIVLIYAQRCPGPVAPLDLDLDRPSLIPANPSL